MLVDTVTLQSAVSRALPTVTYVSPSTSACTATSPGQLVGESHANVTDDTRLRAGSSTPQCSVREMEAPDDRTLSQYLPLPSSTAEGPVVGDDDDVANALWACSASGTSGASRGGLHSRNNWRAHVCSGGNAGDRGGGVTPRARVRESTRADGVVCARLQGPQGDG
jgi:hypothetical protein